MMRVEVAKTLAAWKIGDETGAFRVPRVLDHDEALGTVVLERIHRLKPVRMAFASGGGVELLERIGMALGVVHREMRLPADMVRPLPDGLEAGGECVFIHGDFNGANVCIDERTGSIVVLDWQMTSRHGGEATFGTPFFDLVWFFNYLLWTPTPRYWVRDPITPLVAPFMASYARATGRIGTPGELAGYARRFFEMKRPYRLRQAGLRHVPLLRRSHSLTARYISELERLGSDTTELTTEMRRT